MSKTLVSNIYAQPYMEQVTQIAKKQKLTKFLVDKIIRTYIASLKNALLKGEKVVIPGLVTLYPTEKAIKNSDLFDEYTIKGVISVKLLTDLDILGSDFKIQTGSSI